MHNLFLKLKLIVIIGLLILIAACVSASEQNQVQSVAAANANTKLGLFYWQNGDAVKAKEKLLLAIKEDPKNVLALDSYAYFLEKSGEIVLARKSYLQALEVAYETKKNYGEAQNNYGAFLYRQGKYRWSVWYFVGAAKTPNYLHVANAYLNASLAERAVGEEVMSNKYLCKAHLHDSKIVAPKTCQ